MTALTEPLGRPSTSRISDLDGPVDEPLLEAVVEHQLAAARVKSSRRSCGIAVGQA